MDPVTTSVIGYAMNASAREMGVNLYQAAHSTIVREIRDIGTAIFDADGNTVAMANWIPMLSNALEPAIQAIKRHYDPRELEPGEALLTNDPFDGGQHVNDILLYTPVHHRGRVIALSCANVHHLDVGGGAPASNARATEVFQEGIVFPPIKIRLGGGLDPQPLRQDPGRQYQGAGEDDPRLRRPDRRLSHWGAAGAGVGGALWGGDHPRIYE